MIPRNTIQCSVILKKINELKAHVTADELYEAIVAEYPSISRATVYRNLNKLVEMGKIRKVSVPDGADRFDYLCCDHYHVKCRLCGQLFDVEMDYIADLKQRIKDAHGFEFFGHNIIFDGICPACRRTKIKKNKK